MAEHPGMRCKWLPWFVFGLCPAPLAAQAWLAVGPASWRGVMQPLLAARKAQGLAAEFVDLPAAGDAAAVRDQVCATVHARIRAGGPGYLLLLGDSDRGGLPLPAMPRPGLSTILPGKWPADPVWTDLGYGDPDGRGVPQWPVGRWPVRDAAEVAVLVAKTLDYERTPPGEWLRQFEFVAGDGDFGAVLDTVLLGAMRQLFSEELSPAFQVRPLVALPDSPFFVEPAQFGATLLARLDAGSFVFTYAGHGSLDRFANLRLRGQKGSWPLLRQQDVARLRSAQRTILMAYACHIGGFTADALGETLVRAAHGPVAVFAASTVSYPFGDLLLGRELMHAQEDPGMQRLGDLLRTGLRDLVAATGKTPFHQRAITAAGVLGLGPDAQTALRRYTADVYQLFGDPALRLPAREPLVVALRSPATVGRELVLTVRGQRPCAKLRIELCCDRGRRSDEILAVQEIALAGEPVEVRFPWPEQGEPGYAVVRAFGLADGRAQSGGLRFRVARD